MSKKPFMSHFKTLSWKQEALFCQELADAWAELSILPLWSLHSLKIKKSFRGDNPRGRGKVTVGFHDFHSNSFSFMPFSQYSICVLVTQSRPTLCNPLDCSLPGSSVLGILQARILEWVAIPFCRGSSQHRDRIQVSRTLGRLFTFWATREACCKEINRQEILSLVSVSLFLFLLLFPSSQRLEKRKVWTGYNDQYILNIFYSQFFGRYLQWLRW